jgi:hypothetical protein
VWDYLTSNALSTRQIIAANLTKECDIIVEIGPDPNPIKNYTFVPVLEVRDFGSWQPPILNNYAVIILGLCLENMEIHWLKLFKLINKSKITMLESTTDWQRSKMQLNKILSNIKRKPLWAVDMNFELSEEEKNKYKDRLRLKRKLICI